MKQLNLRGDRAARKSLRQKKVSSIVVEVAREDGTVLKFDGDEQSQQRLDLFSRRAKANGRTSLPWVLANNEVVEVTVDEMEQALDAALLRQSEEWFI